MDVKWIRIMQLVTNMRGMQHQHAADQRAPRARRSTPTFRSQMQRAISLTALLAVLCPTPSSAQVVASIATGITGNELLKRTDKIVQDAIRSSAIAGDGMVSKMATEASVLSRSIEIGLAGQLDKAIRDISDKAVQAPLIRLAEVADQVARAERRFYRVRDTSIIDFQEIASSSIFADSPIFIQRIDGVAYLQQSGDFRRAVTALGLRPMANRTATVRLLIGEKNVLPLRGETGAADPQNPGGAHTRTLVFGADLFAGRFLAGKVAIVPAVLEVVVTTNRTFLSPRVEKISSPIYIALMPRHAGEVKVSIRSVSQGWVKQPNEMSSKPTVSDDCGEGKCRYTFQIEVPVARGNHAKPMVGDQRIVDTRWTCKPLWGPTSCTFPGGWIGIRTDVAGDKSRATMTIEHWAERNEYQFFVAFDEFMDTGMKQTDISVPVIVGEPVTFELPPNTSSYQITGTLVNHAEINFAKGQPNDILIRGVEADEARGVKRVVYQVSREALGL